MLFSVSYSQQKDIQNYLNSLWKFKYLKYGRINQQNKLLSYYPKDFQNKLKIAKTENSAKKEIKQFLNSLPTNFYKSIKKSIVQIDSTLNTNQNKIVSKLEFVYGKKFPFNEIRVFVTTAPMFPYNYKQRWFMTGRNLSDQKHVDTALHELNHFMFYYYYAKELKQLPELKFETIKEAFAILTNPKGSDKPSVEPLEKFIVKNRDKPINQILKLILDKNML